MSGKPNIKKQTFAAFMKTVLRKILKSENVLLPTYNMLFNNDFFSSDSKCCEECGRWFCSVFSARNIFNEDSEFNLLRM